jgi:hypothetical protein
MTEELVFREAMHATPVDFTFFQMPANPVPMWTDTLHGKTLLSETDLV